MLGPFLYTVIDYTFIKELSPRFWNFGLVIYPLVSIGTLLSIAWFRPIKGGIFIVVLCVISLILGFMLLTTEGGWFVAPWFFAGSIALFLPGILFVIFGRDRKKIKDE